MKTSTVALIIAAGIIIMGGTVAVVSGLPRGLRNNNPGNIRKGQNWQGLAAQQADAAFATFATMAYGVRALAKTLITYQDKHGIRTVRGIISRWAPATENDTGAYIASVSAALGVKPDDTIDVRAKLPQLVRAIAAHENGGAMAALHLKDADVAAGVRLALA